MTRSWPEEQLLKDLASSIDSGLVEIDEDWMPCVRRLAEAWPWVDIRIDWRAVPEHRHLPPPPGRRGGSFTLEESAIDLRRFWDEARGELRIVDEAEVLVFGDGNMSFVLRMPAKSLSEHLVDVFSIPMHWYVFPEDAGWCFNYTMEDDVYFGRRPMELPLPQEERRVLESTREQRANSTVEVLEHSILELLSRLFPLQERRIDWARVPRARFFPQPKVSKSLQIEESELERMEQDLIGYWHEAREQQMLPDDEPLVVGGPELSFCLKLPASSLEVFLPDLLATLREFYILIPRLSSCFNYRFEVDAVFGVTPGDNHELG